MTVPSANLPQAVLQDGRWVYSPYDTNNNLVAWPQNAYYTANQATGWATATHNVTAGPEAASASTNLIQVTYQGVEWYFPPQTAVVLPDFITKVLTISGSPYTVT